MSPKKREPLGVSSYLGSEVYKQICNRFYKQHSIKLPDHIAEVYKVGVSNGQGMEFLARDPEKFEALLKMPKFAPDNQEHFCDRIASMATKGQGYRETGVPSLHIAVAPEECSVHIDTFGFVAIGPDGQKYYNPDAIQHILDELLWQDKFVGWVTKHSKPLGMLLSHVHFRGPSSRNRYRLSAGVRVNAAQGDGWNIGIEATQALSGEQTVVGSVEVYNW
ncbi:hypothetical protein [uncultured Roseibium sp.]|uniref:hypothetical protein n=1 Tax=uncultured Roseibium sp. TaxID=1936171 RepID=UPI002634D5FC|nr:hypothetical protein [uncultured Roseibium sp.]